MDQREEYCPSCGTLLQVPTGVGGQVVRCGQCHRRFYLPKPARQVQAVGPRATDDDVAIWLSDYDHLGQDAPALSAEDMLAEADDVPVSGETAIMKALDYPIRLVRLNHSSALFEFPVRVMKDMRFRTAMPRECVRCGARTHLEAHAVAFVDENNKDPNLAEEHLVGSLKLTEPNVRNLTEQQVAAKLPRVPNVPPPANLPMVYWVCDLCKPTGVLSGRVNINPDSGEGFARLTINHLRLVEKFMIATGGLETEAYQAVHRYVEKMAEDPWQSVPEVVRHRLEQWFKRKPSERFIAYVPDRSLARTEDGMFGLLVSNERIIFASRGRRHEVTVRDHFDLELASGTKRKLTIRTPGWDVKMVVDSDGIRTLRRALTKGHYQANWH